MEHLYRSQDRERAAGDPDAVVMEPIIGMEHPWRYRNKAQYPIGTDRNGRLTAGFFCRTHPFADSDTGSGLPFRVRRK